MNDHTRVNINAGSIITPLQDAQITVNVMHALAAPHVIANEHILSGSDAVKTQQPPINTTHVLIPPHPIAHRVTVRS